MATILATGTDVREFLQGQLSVDMAQLTREHICPASCNSPQGRVQAVIWLVERSDAVALLLPSAIVESTIARLRKYVLRSKVKLEAGGDRLMPYILEPTALPMELATTTARMHIEHEGVSMITWPSYEPPDVLPPADARATTAAPHVEAAPHVPLDDDASSGVTQRRLLLASADLSFRTDPGAEAAWHLADVRAGLPQVYPQTHEAFVAQMLNLDLLGGISFEKGCYTGQEIIARMHFRGSVKRRMFRFRAACAPPRPGVRVLAGDAHAGDVVDAAATADGCEILAVISLAQLGAALTLDGSPSAALERLEMPYAVPA